jgi:hypothetical protein
MESTQHDTEVQMAMQSEGNDAQGRNYDQVTKEGSSSIGSMGAGGTGDVGSAGGQSGPGGNNQGGRTDDLLSDGSSEDRADGFVHEEAGELQTGMGGIGSLSTGNAGSRQAEREARPGGDKG